MKQQLVALSAIVLLTAATLPVSHEAEARVVYADRTETKEQIRDRIDTRLSQLTEIERMRDAFMTQSHDRHERIRRLHETVAPERDAFESDEKNEGADVQVTEGSPETNESTETADVNAESEEPQPAPQTPLPTPDIAEPKSATTAPEPVIEEPEGAPVDEGETRVEPSSYLETLVEEIHRLTNIERERAGVAPLAHDTALAAIAEAHSEDMAENEYFSHTSPDGCSVGCRFDTAGYDARAWGENIAWRRASSLPSATELAQTFVDGWMNSDGHRRNMLSGSFTHEGVGVAQIGNTVYATVNFANPR